MKKKIHKKIIAMSIALISLIAAGMLYLGIRRNNNLDITFYQIESEKIEESFRIVQLSDLHLHEFGEKNAVLIDKIKSLNPDILAITGDMNIRGNQNINVVLELCEQLLTIAPVYYVYGNHEFEDINIRNSEIDKELKDIGVEVLNNISEEIEINSNKIIFAGISQAPEQFEKYAENYYKEFQELVGFKVLLVHYPEYFYSYMADCNADLVLSGHAHGGVIRLPGIGGLYTKDQGLFPELTEGAHQNDYGTWIISRGLGDSGIYFRINNNPELVVVDITRDF